MAPDPTAALDRIILGGEPIYTRADLLERSRVPDQLARTLWRALGFPDTGGARAFTDMDLRALQTVGRLIDEQLLDEETVVVIARSLGQSTARLADWQTEAVGRLLADHGDLPDIDDGLDPESMDAIAARAGELIGPLGQLLDYAWRRQLVAVLDRRLARAEVAAEEAVATVGFADLVGFTRLSRQLVDADLAALVESFEAASADVVAATGAQLVKTVGDEIFFVAQSAEIAVDTARQLHDVHRLLPEVPQVRIGLATGHVLRRMGDVFGATVNLASRLTAFARPGMTLVDAATAAEAQELPGVRLRQQAPRRVRGVGIVRAFELVEVSSEHGRR